MELRLTQEECICYLIKQIQTEFVGYDITCARIDNYDDTKVTLTKKEIKNEDQSK